MSQELGSEQALDQRNRLGEIAPRVFEELFNDPTRLEWLLFVGRHYNEQFESDLYDLFQLMSYRDICYLVDFDVLRNFLESGSTKALDTFAVDRFFYDSKTAYAVPAGAFDELLDYLARLMRRQRGVSAAVRNMEREDLIRHVGAVLGVPSTKSHGTDEIADEVIRFLLDTRLVLVRLLHFLTDPRLQGVIADYDEGDATELKEIISHLPRRLRTRDRELRDQRDGENLAIAIKSARESRVSGSKTGKRYILVSQTSIVLSLPERLSYEIGEARETEQEEARIEELEGDMAALCRMLGLSGIIPRNLFPAMHPRQVTNAESLGVFQNPEGAVRLGKTLRQNFRTFTELVEERFISTTLEAEADQDLGTQVLHHVANVDRDSLSRALQDIGQLLMSRIELRQYEERRATEASIQVMRAVQTHGTLTREEEIRAKSTEFMELLSDVLIAVGEVEGFGYHLSELSVPGTDLFEGMVVRQVPDGHDWPVMLGERYRARTMGTEKTRPYYVMRWPVMCSYARFLAAFSEVLGPRLSGVVKEGDRQLPKWVRLADGSTLWEEGIVIFCSDGVFGAPLDLVLHQQVFDVLAINRVRQTITADCGGIVSGDAEVQQYRINTRFGGFLFDIVPPDGELERYMSVMSHYNLATEVATLRAMTTNRFIHRAKLAATLGNGLSEFDPLV